LRSWLPLLALTVFVTSARADPSWLTGRIHSISPTEEVVFVEDGDDNNVDNLIAVDFRDAKVVRVWRDTARPGRWLERPTRLIRWPAGTFVVIIGSVDASGRVRAGRIEIPRADR
jgi:hypothetical protein